MSARKIKVTLEPYRLELFKPFRISRDVYDHKEGFRVILSYGELTGLGEANEHGYYQVTQAGLEDHITTLKSIVEEQNLIHPKEMYDLMEQAIGFQPFALAAMDMAYWDLFAKTQNQPTRYLFDLPTPPPKLQYTSYTISIDDPKEMEKAVRTHPFKKFKVKLGTKDDIQLMHRLLALTDSEFYIDANCAWDIEYATEFAHTFQHTNLKMIEQPLQAKEWEPMAKLKQETLIPLFADESFIHQSDLLKCLDSFDGINIKILKCGGLTPAIEIIRQAIKADAPLMIGCMMESSIGISAAMQVTPWASFIDIDSALFLKNDPAEGCVIALDGQFFLQQTPGNGSSLKKN
jgi:L-alanine-DL-glutamate epimerase-like enolase superfamily enzyme